jgi:hypothetical protein
MRCRAPLHEECTQHHEHKKDPGVTPRTCGAIGEGPSDPSVGEGPGIENTSHPRRLGVTRVRP